MKKEQCSISKSNDNYLTYSKEVMIRRGMATEILK